MRQKPYEHQQTTFDRTKDLPYFGYLWEMRVGKNLPNLLTAEHLYATGQIDTVLIVATNGVHLNWSRNAIPEFLNQLIESDLDQMAEALPELGAAIGDKEEALKEHLIVEWSAQKHKTDKFQELLKKAKTHKGLLWFCVNVEALSLGTNKKTRKASFLGEYLEQLVQKRKVLLICDESHQLKSPKAQRTKTVIFLSKYCPFRRILTGTPASQSPFDLWSQFLILSSTILGPLFVPFKQRYGVFKTMRFGMNRAFDQLVEYKNLEDLYEKIKPHSSRLTEAEVRDLPELVHELRFFELSKHQRRAYDELRDELITKLDSGELITVQQAIVGLIRLQQISRGFVGQPGEGEDAKPKIIDLGSPRPSVDSLMSLIEQVEGKFIVWCKFTQDIDFIMKAFKEKEMEVIRYDGSTPIGTRPGLLTAFRDNPHIKGIIGTPGAGGVGVDMSAASTMIWYSHTYNLTERLQAIARMKGPNQKAKSLLLVDLVAADTTDQKCLGALERKQDIASIVTGDKFRLLLKGE